MEDFLAKLISFPTVTCDREANNAALKYVADFLRRCGVHIAWHEDAGHRSFVATVRPQERCPAVMLCAHIDVVSAPAALWRLTCRDGRYYGRGVMDMKFALAVYMQLVSDLHDQLDAYNFGIMVTSDEETGGEHGTAYLLRQGYRPGVCILPDSAEGWNLETLAKGYHWLRLEATGKAAHGSRPWEGHNALHRLAAVVHDVEMLFGDVRDKYGRTLNVGFIRGGGDYNQIPDYAEAGLDIRFTSAEEEAALMRDIAEICRQHNATVTTVACGAAVATDMSDERVQKFVRIVTAVTGHAPMPVTAFGATDAGFLAETGIVSIISAPPAGGRHGPHEWIDAASLEQYRTILTQYLQMQARA